MTDGELRLIFDVVGHGGRIVYRNSPSSFRAMWFCHHAADFDRDDEWDGRLLVWHNIDALDVDAIHDWVEMWCASGLPRGLLEVREHWLSVWCHRPEGVGPRRSSLPRL